MPKFSLVVATKDRTAELARFINSLHAQRDADYELIIVDQNGDDRLIPILERSGIRDKIIYLKCSPGVSFARNMGMDHARGEILAFPDDDCWYPPELMKRVVGWFDANQSYEILSVTSRDANGECSCNGWFQASCDLNSLNIFRTSGGSCYFIQSSRISQTVRYDEGIGPGSDTPYLCGEDTDFLLTAMRMGARGRFEAKWNIGHPRKDVRGAGVSMERVYGFGQGMGFVQQKHRLGWLCALFMAYDYGRAFCFYPIGRRGQAALWCRHGRGLLDGYLATRPRKMVRLDRGEV